ncbi:hypothetical protein [Roseobacter sp. OBYS 0001]|uniref:hypothetical protein n=1 Tax=Roseobacter sp. OBYS 0001 TaxID=882651 RepID=UPI001BBAC01F|nr:hypothetical protein [Roseobacter sp. OBYS 0001]GIT88876.1 hypothetical protein ROBYS_38920 [Roseobacter sp. OBYS 0001]
MITTSILASNAARFLPCFVAIIVAASLWPADPALADAHAADTEQTCNQDAIVPDRQRLHTMTEKEFVDAAAIEFNRCHRYVSPTEGIPSTFRPNLNFPSVAPTPGKDDQPWKEFHPIDQPELYLDALLSYVMKECGADHIDWNGTKCGWFHAPWMHELREPMRGVTRERSSRLGELHPSQTARTQNWAVGMYNDVGGYAFHQIWGENPAFPKTNDFAFADGTVAVKLLFSTATPEQAPYLRFAKTWDIHNGEEIVTARLIQLDILVKDNRLKDNTYVGAQSSVSNADGDSAEAEAERLKIIEINQDLTGWAMGSYLYNGAIETAPRCDHLHEDDKTLVEPCEQARWRERLVPIGLQWGNDPGMFDPEINQEKVVQHWLNDQVTTMFAAGRAMSGHPAYLGFEGRMNGPVDNYRSTCLACHARAVDFGRYEEDRLKYVPFVPPDMGKTGEDRNAQLLRFFRNLNSDDPLALNDESDQPFVTGTQSLDYSLQAADGLNLFRKWVESVPLPVGVKRKTYNFEPDYGPYDEVPGDLNLVAWNIANLHHETDVALRNGSARRLEMDYANLRKVADELKGHVYALQEIGSPAALARVLDPSEYHFVMSSRYEPGDEFHPPSERDIYTAFAFYKAVFPEPPKVSTLDALSLPHLAYDRRRDAADSRPTRAGLVVEFHHNGHDIALLNVHLKSSCNRDDLADINEDHAGENNQMPHIPYACRTMTAQLEIIENWVEMQMGLGKKVMVMGDFNRQLNVTGDAFWNDLNDGRPRDLVKGPPNVNELCWDRHPAYKHHYVDFILADSALLSAEEAEGISRPGYQSYLNEDVMKAYLKKQDANRLSDHCPVVLQLRGN